MNKLLWVKCKCDDYYKFINKIKYINIKILEIKYEQGYIYLKINSKYLEKLNKYLVSYKFRVVKVTGIYDILNKIKRNYIFCICLLIGTILFFIMSNMVVKINIIHENSEIREIIADELDEYGIKVLSFKKSYKELDKIRQEILDKYPDKLDWMEFDVDGMIINVRIEERIITDTSKDDLVCNLVAAKSGIINDIKVEQGEALVNINDYVKEGDILVTGVINYNEETKRTTCASGEIYATTWYTVDVKIPFEYSEYEETGKKKYNIVWENDGNKKQILRERFDSYNSYLKNILKVFDFNLYVETEMETKKITKTYTEEEALEVGINKAIENVKIKLGEKDEIIDKKVLKKVVNNSTMDIEVFVIVKELISTQEEIIVDTEEGT